MRESKERIIEYTKALVGLKEKVVAVAILFAVSAVMMISVSFAWLAISQNPELSGVTTSIAGNGNLEIALATGSSSASTKPAESAVGDSNKPLVDKNITWGNLINLSDPVYGLDQLVLRPAMLNESGLKTTPLYGAEYTADGRISKLNSNFAFATWVESTEAGIDSRFEISDLLGVRAITSTKMAEEKGYAYYLQTEKEYAESLNIMAQNMYINMTNNRNYMQSLATIMGTYMTARLNASQGDESLTNPTMDKGDIENLRDMFAEFIVVMDKEAEALAALANFQQYVNNKGYYLEGTETPAYIEYTAESLIADQGNLATKNIQITDFASFISDYNLLKTDYENLVNICELATIKWADDSTGVKLSSIIDRFVNIGECTIDGTPIKNIGASNASGYLNKSCNALITNGILERFEKRTGAKMYVGSDYNNGKGVQVSATVKRGITIPGKIYALISTSAEAPSHFYTDIEYGMSRNTGGTAKLQAKDTFGLAVDLWVRTNQLNSYLTLQGNVLIKEETVRATGTAKDGNEVELYTFTQTVTSEDESGEEVTQDFSFDVYKLTEDGTEKWYRLSNHAELTAEEMNGQEPTPKMIVIETVIGYEGDNRVWEGSYGLSVNSTTQGSGSCYVYYADTPEDQARSLELLKSMKVAFVDGEGNLLAMADMDTAHFYADNGKVIVPLVLRSDSIAIEDHAGNTTYAITTLERNVPTRITAIVYLDGTQLTNEDVLASADIQGQLNIQFGTAVSLVPIENEELMSKEVFVSANVSDDSFDYDTATSENPMTTTVTVNVGEAEPKTVTAFFIRSISSSQGSRETVMNFTPNGDGTWSSDYTFTSPGNYILRSVQLDGVDYDLNTRLTVTVTGFSISSLTWEEATHALIMTAGKSKTIPLAVKFATDDPEKLPTTVQGRFLRNDDGTAVSINFTYNSITNTWIGNANFVTSGEYTLQYLVLNGEYVELEESLRKYATVYLGMKVRVIANCETDYKYIPSEMPDSLKNAFMQVIIMDDNDEEIAGLDATNDIVLKYKLNTSNVTKMETSLIWNASSEYYEGTFDTISAGVGVFVFESVFVGNNEITVATSSPTFVSRSPEPPAYYDHATVAEQFAPVNSSATMNVQLSYSASADGTTATIVQLDADGNFICDADGNPIYYTVSGSIGSAFESEDGLPINNWFFAVPNNNSGTQDGYWQLVSVHIWGVYNEQGSLYTQDQPLVFDDEVLSDNNKTRVVATITIKFAENQSKDFSGNFMDSYTVSGINVSIFDFENKAIKNIRDVTLIYDYDGDTDGYGGYTSASILAIDAFATINLVQGSGSDAIKFTQNADLTLQYAGCYTPSVFSFFVGTKEYKFTAKLGDAYDDLPYNVPAFSVYSKAPSATITAISPTGENPTGITYTIKDLGWRGKEPTFATKDSLKSNLDQDNNTATLYAVASADNSTQRHGTFTRPTITIKIDGISNEYDATIILPAGSADSDITSSCTGNKNITMTLGSVKQINKWTSNFILTHTLDAYYGHGEQTISTMTVSKNGVNYTIYLEKPIVIINPSSQ